MPIYNPGGGGSGSDTLSALQIDTDKDWLGRLIKNTGTPVDGGDTVNKDYADDIPIVDGGAFV